MKPDGGPAYPLGPVFIEYADGKDEEQRTMPGMSLRDWFAGKAIGPIIDGARKLLLSTQEMPTAEAMAHSAYVLADAMLAERAK